MKHQVLNIRKPRIDVVPIIDTIFLLLLYFFFVVLHVTSEKGIHVNLPRVEAASGLDTSQDYCVVTMTESGGIFFNKDRVTLDELSSLLKTWKQETIRGNTTVCIRGEPTTKHSDIIKVLEVITRTGGGNVLFEAVETENKGGMGL